MTREEIEARYHQVLFLARQGLRDPEIGAQMGVSPGRAWSLRVAAQRWAAQAEHRAAECLDAPAPVGALRLPARAIHGLQRQGLRTVGDVACLSDTELLAIRGIGPTAVAALRADLAARYRAESDGRDR